MLLDLTFLIEVMVGLPRRRPIAIRPADRRAAIVVPAHNEALVIGRCIAELREAAGPGIAIVVVADNCNDDTATIAGSEGATVLERHDLTRRGKGHALAFARRWLRQDPPAAVIVVDADCRTDRSSLCNLVARTLADGRPSQAINLLEPSLDSPAMVQISTFAFLVKNLVRQRGLQRLTGAAHLTGTGMCLTWDQYDRADLATSEVVEDLRLTLEMSRRGTPPQLVENAFVWSPHAAMGDTLTQRSRWEGGYMSLAHKTAPEAILRGLRTGSPRQIITGLDLLVPPLALLAMINIAALLLAGLLAATGVVGWTPALLLGVTDLAVTAAVLASWWLEGRASLAAGKLLSLPLYALWKIPLYLAALTKGAPSEWLRTRRTTSGIEHEPGTAGERRDENSSGR